MAAADVIRLSRPTLATNRGDLLRVFAFTVAALPPAALGRLRGLR
ncbi:hypothetical protein V1227_01885 [Lentzea sp. DG1S-22]|nr:hypothetical protein [Lentzea sp. DG1S-22]WVH81531.1 hypothetical protein V1227_01885 [Lentzea sp. DG1S-22]